MKKIWREARVYAAVVFVDLAVWVIPKRRIELGTLAEGLRIQWRMLDAMIARLNMGGAATATGAATFSALADKRRRELFDTLCRQLNLAAAEAYGGAAVDTVDYTLIQVVMPKAKWEELLMWMSDGVAERAVGSERADAERLVLPIRRALGEVE